MRVSFQVFHLPKSGNSDDEYEDAFWPLETFEGQEREEFCCAVADGATETSFAGYWANLLVQEICEYPDPSEFVARLPDLQRKWCEVIGARLLPWYAEQKAHSGAFAAVLGVEVFAFSGADQPCFGWRAFAVGDACLIQMRGTDLIEAFPLKSPLDFSNHPYLVCSRPDQDSLEGFLQSTSGDGCPGDALYLMTDAMACWFLAELDRGGYDLRNITSQPKFERLIRGERLERNDEGQPRMRNDDMTLIRIEVTP